MHRGASIMAASTAALTLLWGCTDREVAHVPIQQTRVTTRDVPVEVNREVDILFVVDNSQSMREEQASLAANFDRFIGVLEGIEGGLPDVRIGVISTDLGADPRIPHCEEGGDGGALQTTPSRDCALAPGFLDGAFIRDVTTSDGGRERNYQGTLAEAFSCIAKLGTSGCGFEMPLESMRRALQSDQGFLREDAYLAVIFITDEDDCSTRDARMFDTEETALDGPLGPLSSFRCFEFGVACAPDQPRALGAKAECVPREGSRYMYGVQEYVDFLEELKGGAAQVIVAGIIGNAGPVSVDTAVDNNGATNLVLEPSCTSSSGEAAPAVRLTYFLEQFPGRNTITTICNEDLSHALTLVAELLRSVFEPACLAPTVDLEPEREGVQHDCQLSDVRSVGGRLESETVIAQCSSSTPEPAEYPCWHIEAGSSSCTSAERPLELVIERGGSKPPAGTQARLQCLTR